MGNLSKWKKEKSFREIGHSAPQGLALSKEQVATFAVTQRYYDRLSHSVASTHCKTPKSGVTVCLHACHHQWHNGAEVDPILPFVLLAQTNTHMNDRSATACHFRIVVPIVTERRNRGFLNLRSVILGFL